MRGIILAAGRGSRLAGVTGAHPKCLARIGPATLIERQLQALRDCGVDPVTVVAGYHANDVFRVCGTQAEFVQNTRHATTNSLYSLWLARDILADGFVVLNCDVLFHRQMLADLITARYEDALLIGTHADGSAYTDEEMKVQVRRGLVDGIAKTIAPEDADGENVGIAKFGASGAAVLVEELNTLVASGAHREWLPAAFAAFARRRPLHVVDSRGFPWIEIDTPEDYWRACTEVLPAIDTADDVRQNLPKSGTTASAPGRTAHV